VRHAALAVALAAALAAVAPAVSGCAAAGGHPRDPRDRHADPKTSYYLSLGDSLSVGVQPNAAGKSVPTAQGYADQLYAALRAGDPGLRLVKLGCSGETTHTMIDGGICSYPAGSQLAQAVSFLRAHRGHISLITIDIGANDPDSCVTRTSIGAVISCVTGSFPGAVRNLTTIMSTIRAAAGSGVRIIGMNYYVPELSEWLNGPDGQELARLSEGLVVSYNRQLTTVYQRFGARVANVFGAFHSGDFTGMVQVPGVGTVPRNVATVCLWTWECAAAPRGPNEHARSIGYAVIARAFMLADQE
jgi:lysophospholipase L1-like esterase